MSAGNACAAIGLANTNKIPHIGEYVQDPDGPPGPSADGPYIGVNGSTFYTRNVLGELVDPAYFVPANFDSADGLDAQWVTTGGAPMTVAVDGRCSVSATGVITATPTTGLFTCVVAPGTVIPAGSYLWAFQT